MTQPVDEPALDDPDILPDSLKTNGPCSRCGRVSNFTLRGSAPVTFVKDGSYAMGRNGPERLYDQQVSILECNGCQDCVVVIEDQYVGGRRGGRGGEIHYRGFFWWPPRGAGSLGDGVSSAVAAAFDEGVRCLSAGAPNGAVAMFRTALTYMVEERGSVAAKNAADLKEKIRQMIRDGGPLGALGDWADHVRLYGNAGAHPDKFGDVTLPEAQEVAKLVNTMIELLYVLPANIARRQAERRP